jgi:vacuolar protein sorting-associated protein 13A/C
MAPLQAGGKYFLQTFGSPLIVTNSRRYPKMELDLMAPIQLENLLPYNLQYRIYDKDADQNWRSYLRAGGIMPIHSVELNHLLLLNIEINDTGSSVSLR